MDEPVEGARHDKWYLLGSGLRKSGAELGRYHDLDQAISARHKATLDDIGVVMPCCEARARLERELAAGRQHTISDQSALIHIAQ